MAEHEGGMAVALRRKRFPVDEYHRMGEVGILVLAPGADGYAVRGPSHQTCGCWVEVADSPLAYDRGLKIPLYADVRSVRMDRRLAPLAFPDISVAVADLIP